LFFVLFFCKSLSQDYGQDNQVTMYNNILTNTTVMTRLETRVLAYLMVQVEYPGNATINETFANTTKGTFFPTADNFAQMTISNSGSYFRNDTDVYIFLNIGGHLTEKRYYKQSTLPEFFVGSFSAIVQIVNGLITGIAWDDGCANLCDNSVCLEGKTCAIAYSDPSVNNCNDVTACPISVYLAWVGTDAQGTVCNSDSFLPSRMSAYSINQVYRDAANIAVEHNYVKPND